MKVVSMNTVALSVSLTRPFTGGRQQPRERINPVLAQLKTEDGLEAFGLAFTWNDRRVKSLKACIDDLKEIAIG